MTAAWFTGRNSKQLRGSSSAARAYCRTSLSFSAACPDFAPLRLDHVQTEFRLAHFENGRPSPPRPASCARPVRGRNHTRPRGWRTRPRPERRGRSLYPAEPFAGRLPAPQRASSAADACPGFAVRNDRAPAPSAAPPQGQRVTLDQFQQCMQRRRLPRDAGARIPRSISMVERNRGRPGGGTGRSGTSMRRRPQAAAAGSNRRVDRRERRRPREPP